MSDGCAQRATPAVKNAQCMSMREDEERSEDLVEICCVDDILGSRGAVEEIEEFDCEFRDENEATKARNVRYLSRSGADRTGIALHGSVHHTELEVFDERCADVREESWGRGACGGDVEAA